MDKDRIKEIIGAWTAAQGLLMAGTKANLVIHGGLTDEQADDIVAGLLQSAVKAFTDLAAQRAKEPPTD